MKNVPMPLLIAALLSTLPVAAAELQSAARLTFGDDHTLFIADWKAGRIYAAAVPAGAPASGAPFNLRDVEAPIARALHVPAASLRFEDLVVQPGSGTAWVALTIGAGAKKASAAVVAIDAAGKVTRLNTSSMSSYAAITDAPPAKDNFWRSLPAQSLTVTDMKFYDRKLYVAGLSNRSFASTLRVFDYPFKGASAGVATIEMYHPVHNQIETRAPIRQMTFVDAGGVPSLLAAYTCTPLVLIPLDQLKDGAHIAARTIGEMGWGSAPTGLVTYKVGGADFVLLTNSSRAADLMTMADIARAGTLPGLAAPISVPDKPTAGVAAMMAPMSAVLRIDNLNDKLLLALRRDAPSGHMELVTIPKGAYLRVSDFVNEYDFKDYVYPPTDTFREYHKFWRTIEGYPELAR